MLSLAAGMLGGCTGSSDSANEIDPSCFDLAWLADAADAVDVERETFQAVLATIVSDVQFTNGDWADDFGDARFYGPAVLLGLGHEIDSPCLLAFGRASLDGGTDGWSLLGFDETSSGRAVSKVHVGALVIPSPVASVTSGSIEAVNAVAKGNGFLGTKLTVLVPSQ